MARELTDTTGKRPRMTLLERVIVALALLLGLLSLIGTYLLLIE